MMLANPEVHADDGAMRSLKQHLVERTGLAYYHDKERTLDSTIRGRMRALRIPRVAAYTERLRTDKGEWATLIDEMAIGETFFFRHQAQFEALRDMVVPDLVARHKERRTLRIWSVGCANGPEPFSVSILLRTELSHLVVGWDIEILATDISEAKLSRAQRARFGDWDLRGVGSDVRERCFRKVGGEWHLREEYRAGVAFRAQNLILEADQFARDNAGSFDIILCRNVFIYFSQDAIRHVLDSLHVALGDGGWLLVGHADPHFDIVRRFQTCPATGTMLYRKGEPADHAHELAREGAYAAPSVQWPLHDEPEEAPCDQWLVRTEEILAAMRASPRKCETLPEPARPAAVSLDRARQLIELGRWKEAAAACHRSIDVDPLDADTHFLLAQIQDHDGERVAAEDALARAIYLDRNFALAHYHLGCSAALRGDTPAAMRALHNVVALLQSCDDDPVRAGNGLTAAELRALAGMQLKTLESQ